MTTEPALQAGTVEAVLQVESLRVSLGHRNRREILGGVDLTIHAGETVALVGESGSGKSTTANAVLGLLPRSARVDGRIRYGDTDLLGLSAKRMRALRGQALGYVPQDPSTSLNPVVRVGAQVAEPLLIHGLVAKHEVDAAVRALLEKVGVDRPEMRMRQYPHQLSGGLKQRILIAIALAGRPRLLVADEPTSALDVSVQRQILDHLAALAADDGIAMLLITHDLAMAAERADRILVMRSGEVVEQGGARQVIVSPQHEYTRALVADIPSLHTAERPPPAPSTGPPLLSVSGLTRRFRLDDGRLLTAVDDVSFTLDRGQTLGILGESGSGKSTTARIVVGLERADEGSVLVDDIDPQHLSPEQARELRKRVQVIYQNPLSSIDPRYTAGKAIDEALRVVEFGDAKARRARVAELLDMVALPTTLAHHKPRELSGGQAQRVAIARALAMTPELLVCDEAVSALDVTVQAQIIELLLTLQRDMGLSYLFISHDVAVVRMVSDFVGVMQRGRLVEHGPTREVFDDPTDPYTRHLLAAVPRIQEGLEACPTGSSTST
jgi:peptide/nickel transport system ATP-binding protein